ncbi:putative polyketide synthase [Phaeosphaeria sp. MPI-PUGE-AT-0046c]|nr:putative polyketide synthase [Phaeosphaeria sp. MPI-PUGE-AT-0046c]
MASICSIYIFGDQTDDARSLLRVLLRVEHDPILETFLKHSATKIRSELSHSCQVEHDINVSSASLLELVDADIGGSQKVAVDHALTSICQFGLFFKHCHEQGGHYPSIREACFIGLCTGDLTATAIRHCQSTSTLLPVAVEVVALSFRAGLLATEVGACHASELTTHESRWAMVVPGVGAEVAVEEIVYFSKIQGLSKATTPYLGSILPSGVTVCGPPYVLSQFRGHLSLKDVKTAPLPIYAPYHALHLFPKGKLDSLLTNSPGVTCGSPHGTSKNASLQDDELVFSTSLRTSLSATLGQIFRHPLNWSSILSKLNSEVPKSSAKIRIIPIASGASHNLLRSLQEKRDLHVQIVKPIIDPHFNSDYTRDLYQITARSKIAVVGAAGRFPSADSIDAFWDLLLQGRDVHKSVPPLRWAAKSHVDTSEKPAKNTSATPYGCWLEQPGLFDAGFFGMSPREAEQVDPAQRLALMTAYEALEDGGIVPGARSTQRDRVGVVYGVTSNDWMETNSAQNIDTYMIPGGNRAFIPGRINFAFKFSGPSYAVDTACSSSLAAIDIACKSLWKGEVDTMIVGGTNIITNPDFTAGLDKGRFLSRTGNCKTFDNGADGYCRGEGVATVILKRLEDAVLDGDTIKGVIVNACTNHSAEAESMTRPYVQAQEQIFTKVLNGLNPAKVSYVEMHGTGTQVGDATEMLSVSNAVAPKSGPRRRQRANVVNVGSVKANVGHGEAVAGVTSLIKLLMMMRHNTIPPHIGIKTVPNRKFPEDLTDRGLRIATKQTSWNKNGAERRYALLNNFSAAGGNTTLLLEDGPVRNAAATFRNSQTIFPITISAKTPSALLVNATSLLSYILENPHTDLQSLSYTTTARRMHHAYRVCFCGSTSQEIARSLRDYLETKSNKSRSPKPFVIFAFTGQGGQYMGMGRTLYHTNTFFKTTIDQYCDLAELEGFPNPLPLICANEGDVSDFGACATQLAITCIQMALSKLWQSWGVRPAGVIGHSLGHYAALNTAGVLSEADTIYAVGARAQLLEEKCPVDTHYMLAVRADESTTLSLVAGIDAEIACVNSPHETVLSGEKDKIEVCRETFDAANVRSKILDMRHAFHSSQVDCVLDEYEVALRGVHFNPPRMPIVCPRLGQIVRNDGVFNATHLVEHFRKSVNIVNAIGVTKLENFITPHTTFVEIGHTTTFSAMLKANLGSDCNVYSSFKPNFDNWTSMSDALKSLYISGIDIRWDQYHRDSAPHLSAIQLPPYGWDLKNYWIPYVNDWSLRKGEPAQITVSSTRPTLLSRTIHSVISENVANFQGTLVVRSNLDAPQLSAMSQGHKVKGLALCTPSLYADIALTVGRYLQGTYPMLCSKQILINDMVVEKALVVQTGMPQWLETRVHIGQHIRCGFWTVQNDGSDIMRHATCELRYESPNSPEALHEQAHPVAAAIKDMQDNLRSGNGYRFNTSMIYRMVATLADFSPSYRGLSEIVLNSASMSALGIVDFNALPKEEHKLKFAAHPAHIDSFSQLAGFVMNANEASDLEAECFVNHGWGSLAIYEEFDATEAYQAYVKMSEKEKKVWQGTVTVLRGCRVVAVFKDITLQGIPPRLLHQVLLSASKIQSGPAQPDENYITLFNDSDVANINPAPIHVQDAGARLASDLATLLDIVSEESGIAKTDLYDDMQLVDLGIDSLLSLLIASRLKDDLGFDLGHGKLLFDEFKTLKELKEAYAKSKYPTMEEPVPSSSESTSCEATPTTCSDTESPPSNSSSSSAPTSSEDDFTPPTEPTNPNTTLHPSPSSKSSNSLVLHDPSSPLKTLFLFPDGSGSASSYTSLIPNPSIRSIALLFPHRLTPSSFPTTLPSLLTSYIHEIRRRQSPGPYSLGGWSAGGIFAFIAAQMLLDAGEEVSDVILIDSPDVSVGKGLDRLPRRFYEWCEAEGVFGGIGKRDRSGEEAYDGEVEDGAVVRKRTTPDWLVSQFERTIELLASYKAQPLRVPEGMRMPRVAIYWAGQPALDNKFKVKEEDGEGVKFLVERRKDWGPGRWEGLFPGVRCRVEVLKECDHFSMMRGDGAAALSKFIDSALLGVKE